MKKLYLILCAGILALAAASCGKEIPPAKPMSAPEIKQKLANAAVDALKEVDPDIWKDWAQTWFKLANSFSDVQQGNLEDFSDDLQEAMQSIVSTGNKTTITNIFKLSQFKGDVTVVNNAFHYTKSNNPFNITYTLEGKTYKARLESSGESGDGIVLREREYEGLYGSDQTEVQIDKLVVPAQAAVHVTQDGKAFLDAVINPVVEDKDKNGILDENDVIKGSATINIPGYSLALNNLSVSDDGVTAAIDLSHAGKNVLTLEGDVEMDLFIERVKALNEVTVNSLPDDISAAASLLGGTVLLKADIDQGDLINAQPHYGTEAEARKVADVFTKNAKADLYFDNNPTIQASLYFLVEEDKIEGWNIIPGVHLYDGSADVPLAEFFDITEDVWKPVTGELTAFSTKLSKYFDESVLGDFYGLFQALRNKR